LDADPDQFHQDPQELPSHYGKVIYLINEGSSDHLYIIGMGHRDTFTLKHSSDSYKSQIEVYRIAEWIIRNEGPELLLPEGFFSDYQKTSDPAWQHRTPVHSVSLDRAALEEKLRSDTVYTNAEMLLMEGYGIRSQQVEDAELYLAVQSRLSMLDDYKDNPYQSLFALSIIEYFQERRTAAMLQKIPAIVNEEYLNGRINNKKAIFTVGLDHISSIIKYFRENQIAIHSPAFVSALDDYFDEVKLLKENFGVTVIIPNSLVENREIVRLTRLQSEM
jgi:hypothetical protein